MYNTLAVENNTLRDASSPETTHSCVSVRKQRTATSLKPHDFVRKEHTAGRTQHGFAAASETDKLRSGNNTLRQETPHSARKLHVRGKNRRQHTPIRIQHTVASAKPRDSVSSDIIPGAVR